MSGPQLLLVALGLALSSCNTTPNTAAWIVLFDGADAEKSSLGQFESSQFGGDGDIAVVAGSIHLGYGSPLTGITWTGKPPTGDYEFEVTAARLSGIDFFCGVTFPVRESHLTLVLGGWGGAVSGLSNLDDEDASNNPTRTLRYFENNRDYVITVRVRGSRVDVEIDGAPFLGLDHRQHQLSLRPEVELSRPFGIAAYATEAAVRSVRWRPL